MGLASLVPHLSGPPPQVFNDLPEVAEFLFEEHLFKVMWGGREGIKSWSAARYLITRAYTEKTRILCARETQVSIRDSAKKLIEDQIELMGLGAWFRITQTVIECLITGTEFIFKGLKQSGSRPDQSIKSLEGIKIVWLEEAQYVSKDSWETLIPTVVRNQGAEIIVTFNPMEETDETYSRFIPRCVDCVRTFEHEDLAQAHRAEFPSHQMVLPPRGAAVRKTSWRDNPSPVGISEQARLELQEKDPEGYAHVYEGATLAVTDAVIFKGKYVIEDFETPVVVDRWFHGVDFGYGPHPGCICRAYITQEKEWADPFHPGKKLPAGQHLWVDQEFQAHGVENDDLGRFYSQIETAKTWPIKADCSRPETISDVRSQGFNISAAEKWQGSVEDGIFHLRKFVLMHIHPRCKEAVVEARMYRRKIDKITKQVLPEIVDAWNHFWDSLRYALDGYIQRRGASGVWAKLGQKA